MKKSNRFQIFKFLLFTTTIVTGLTTVIFNRTLLVSLLGNINSEKKAIGFLNIIENSSQYAIEKNYRSTDLSSLSYRLDSMFFETTAIYNTELFENNSEAYLAPINSLNPINAVSTVYLSSIAASHSKSNNVEINTGIALNSLINNIDFDATKDLIKKGLFDCYCNIENFVDEDRQVLAFNEDLSDYFALTASRFDIGIPALFSSDSSENTNIFSSLGDPQKTSYPDFVVSAKRMQRQSKNIETQLFNSLSYGQIFRFASWNQNTISPKYNTVAPRVRLVENKDESLYRKQSSKITSNFLLHDGSSSETLMIFSKWSNLKRYLKTNGK